MYHSYWVRGGSIGERGWKIGILVGVREGLRWPRIGLSMDWGAREVSVRCIVDERQPEGM